CPIDDPPALAAQLRRVLENPALREHLAATAYAAYQADFTRDVVIDRLLDIYATCTALGTLAQDRTIPLPHAADPVAAAYAAEAPDLARDAARLQASSQATLI